MSTELYEFLRDRWKYDNHSRYQHYFDPWVNNLTESQIYYFNKQMNHIKNGSLTNWITKK